MFKKEQIELRQMEKDMNSLTEERKECESQLKKVQSEC
jgi:uncharacterized protein YlxW (UPF0749 family)